MSVETKVSTKTTNKNFFSKMLSDYRKFSTKKERFFDWAIPAIIAFIISILIIFIISDVDGIFTLLIDFNNIVLTIVAILAGFNTASLSVIAASNTKVLGQLDASVRIDRKDEKSTLLRQILSLFGYSIIIELGILILGTIFIFLLNGGSELAEIFINSAKIILIIRIGTGAFIFFWIWIILHCLFVSIRSISILYNFILYLGHIAKEESDSRGI